MMNTLQHYALLCGAMLALAPGFPIDLRDVAAGLPMLSRIPHRIDSPFGGSPSIIAMLESDHRSLSGGPFYSAFERERSGLTIHEIVTTKQVPLLGYLFFDSGSAEIPSRYHRFDRPEDRGIFSEGSMPVDAVEAHASVLDLIGSRLQRFPGTTVSVHGASSEQPAIGEVAEIARWRGIAVRRYLTEIWEIDTSRVRLLPVLRSSDHYSSRRDPLGVVEKRRATIISDDWEIIRPVETTRTGRHAYPATAIFRVDNGISDTLIAERRLEIRRGEMLWSTRTIVDPTVRDIPLDSWERDEAAINGADEIERLPNDTLPLEARLVIIRKDGIELASAPFRIPVTILDSRSRPGVDSTMIISTVIEFRFDSPEPGKVGERVIRELVPLIAPGSRIIVEGHNDIVGMEDRNMRLTEQRAHAVATIIRTMLKPGMPVTICERAFGETMPLHTNAMPAGRYLNRSVRVTIIRPK